MTHISVTVPDGFVEAAGSADAVQHLLLTAGIHELVRRGVVKPEVAQVWLGEAPDDWLRLADEGGAFDFWSDEREDVYTLDHGEPV